MNHRLDLEVNLFKRLREVLHPPQDAQPENFLILFTLDEMLLRKAFMTKQPPIVIGVSSFNHYHWQAHKNLLFLHHRNILFPLLLMESELMSIWQNSTFLPQLTLKKTESPKMKCD